MVRCPRECGVDVERGCLKGHLKGSCDLEAITCACGESITRREQQSVLDLEQADGRDVNENTIGCIHEWQACSHCSTQIRRMNQKAVYNFLDYSNFRTTYKLVQPNNHNANIVQLASRIPQSKSTMKLVPLSPSLVLTLN
jgi:hypothetical protein